MTSGTQGNLVAQMAHLARGQETIAGREHHLVIDEAAGHAVIVGASIRALSNDRPDGTVDPAEIEPPSAIRATRTSRSAGSSPSRTPTPIRWASR